MPSLWTLLIGFSSLQKSPAKMRKPFAMTRHHRDLFLDLVGGARMKCRCVSQLSIQ